MPGLFNAKRSQARDINRALTRTHPTRYETPSRNPGSPLPPATLAAAKRGGRGGRGRLTTPRTTRGRPSSAATNGHASPVVSFAVPAGPSASPASVDERRNQLLRRLNQISQERSRIQRVERRASRDNPNGDSPNGAPGVDLHSSSRPARPDDARNGTLNGARKSPPAPQKRRRGEPVAEVGDERGGKGPYAARSRTAEDSVADSKRNGRHTAQKRVQAVPGKDTAMHLDLKSADKPSRVAKLDLTLVEGKKAPLRTPPVTPSLGTRGSVRVRTPSVLLSSHPGEKVPPLKPNLASKNRQVGYCLRIVKDMLRLKDGFGFSKPIDQLWSVDQLPGYFEMITSPMDLDTVRQRLESGYYMSSPGKQEVEEVTFDAHTFSSDMRLIFKNARTYNRAGDVFYEAATRLLEKFESKMKQMPSPEQLAAMPVKKSSKKRRKGQPSSMPHEDTKKSEVSKRRKSSDADGNIQHKKRPPGKKKVPGGSSASGTGGVNSKPRAAVSSAGRKKTGAKSTLAPGKDVSSMNAEELEARLRALERRRNLTQPGSPAATPAAGQPAYLAEAQALYHVEVTFEEKVEIINNVSKLPPEKLRKVVSMAKKTSTSMEVNKNEEVEFDIEAMDNKTLRDIQALVNQTLFRSKKGQVDSGPNGDILQMPYDEVMTETERVVAALKKMGKDPSHDDNDKNQKSFYDSDSSSDSDSDGSGSESDDEESSSDDSDDSSDEETQSERMRKNRERNAAHAALQKTPMSSPPYQGQ